MRNFLYEQDFESGMQGQLLPFLRAARQEISFPGYDGQPLFAVRYDAQSPCGTVISQGISAYSLSALGSFVDLSVSAGVEFSEKKVPDLYGLTLEEARERLAEVGLVCGEIYSVQSGAGKTTIVSQSIAAGTPITSGVVSVDVYVSS